MIESKKLHTLYRYVNEIVYYIQYWMIYLYGFCAIYIDWIVDNIYDEQSVGVFN